MSDRDLSEFIVGIATPKAGTHMLAKVLKTFVGMEDLVHFGHMKPDHKDLYKYKYRIHMIRLARNILFSWMRFTNIPFTIENIEKQIPLCIQRIKDFLPYLNDPRVYTVKFELVLTERNEIQGVADHIGLPLAEKHFEKIWGDTRTFTLAQDDGSPYEMGNHIFWQDYWTNYINHLWIEHGGEELEIAMGYDDPNKEYWRDLREV